MRENGFEVDRRTFQFWELAKRKTGLKIDEFLTIFLNKNMKYFYFSERQSWYVLSSNILSRSSDRDIKCGNFITAIKRLISACETFIERLLFRIDTPLKSLLIFSIQKFRRKRND